MKSFYEHPLSKGAKIAIWLIPATIFLVTLNMRPAITSIGPLLEDIAASFDIQPTGLGLLGSLPVIMFGLIAPIAASLAYRLGLNQTVLLALIFLIVGILVRSFAGVMGLWVGAALATAAIALLNVLVPVIVRRDYAKHISLATGVYSATMGIGAAVASVVAVPLALQMGWQNALAVWAIPALVVAFIWLFRLRVPRAQMVETHTSVNVFKLASAWWLTLLMGLQSSTFYFMINWLPSMQMSFGRTAAEGGVTLFWYQISGLIAGLFIPIVIKRSENQTLSVFIASIPLPISFLGFLLLPNLSLIWALFMGVGSGASLVVTLSLIAMRGRSAAETSKLSAMVQSIGYFISALAPFLGGVLLQHTGSWQLPLIMMIGLSSLQVVISAKVGKADSPSA